MLEPATLTIKLSASAGSNLEAFGYAGSGQDFVLYPFTRSAAGIELRITHFSGAGVAKNLPKPDLANLRAVAGTVRILLRQAETGPAGQFQRAVEHYIVWRQLVQRLPERQRAQLAADIAELQRSFERGLAHFTDEERKACIDQHDLSELKYVRAMLAQLFGAGLIDQDDPLAELPTKCARFELTYDADIRSGFDRSDFVIGETHVRVEKLPLGRASFAGDSLVFAGAQADLTLIDHRPDGIVIPPGVPCYYTWQDGNRARPFVVKKLKIDLGQLPASPMTTSAIMFTLSPGEWSADDYFNCPGTQPIVDQDGVYFLGWFHLHESDLVEGEGYLVGDWNFVGGDPWARRTYERDRHIPGNPGRFASEKTTFELKHTPQR